MILGETLPRWSLEGKAAIVTGGTKGIGKAIVEELASLGAKVLTCSRTEEDVTACVAEWKAKGLEVQGIAVDVSTTEGRQTLFNSAEQRFGGALDILVNNVGRSIRKTSTFDYTPQEFAVIIDVNFNSVLLLTQLLHPLLKTAAEAEGARARGGSSVVNVSSIAGVTAVKTGAVYAASKAAINRLTINWGCEWAKDGIRVNAVAPGATNTPSMESVPRHRGHLGGIRMEIAVRTAIGTAGGPRPRWSRGRGRDRQSGGRGGARGEEGGSLARR